MILDKIKDTLPIKLKTFLLSNLGFIIRNLQRREIKKIRKFHPTILKKIQQKDKIQIAFLVIHASVWKYEEIYKLLLDDPKFNVTLAIVPLVRAGEPDMEGFNNTLNYFTKNKYKVLSTYIPEEKKWIDIKEKVNPDIVFFTNPHKLTFEKYYFDYFSDRLTCYVPYAFVVIHSIQMHYDQKIHHGLWKHFVETEYHKTFSQKYINYSPSNVIVTGFPGLDTILSEKYNPINPWKLYNGNKAKKIIWAPHHTIRGAGVGLDYSSFEEYAHFFLDLLENNSNLQMAFKPHPLLKDKLYRNKDWGKTKTNTYYSKWDTLPNGQLEDGGYVDLFHFSDALILDSASFIVEYLYFNKPLLFTMRDHEVLGRFNSFGQRVFDYMYKAHHKNDIRKFIENVIINGEDPLKKDRTNFHKNEVLPQNGKTASQNIYEELKKELC